MMMEMTPVVVAGVTQVARVLADAYIKPKLDELYKESRTQKELDLIEYNFREYIERSYNIYLYMNTIVFKNQQKTINDLYIPLTVVKAKNMSDKRNVEILIDKYKDGFIPYYKKVLLVDNAGMGKSTVIKYLYLSVISEKKGIPILIELRKLDNELSVVDFIMNEINGIRKCFNIDNILELIERGDFIFFFDGYDEITEDVKKQITENIQDFISKASNNTFIISSREESELGCFGDFQRFYIRPLKKEEAYELIKKYDQDGELSKELIEKIETQKNLKIINEFLENPLMVSLLYKAFEYKKIIPYKKHIFYRQVYDALFEDHDMSKGGAYVHPKKSKMDIEDFHRVLRAIGFITLTKGITYSKEELIDIVNQAKKKVTGIEFNANNFIDDVISAVPLFIKDGIEYKWSHKSFQEYFAACYISYDGKDKQSLFLKRMIEMDRIEKYYNVLDFCYDIDYKEFMRTIIYPIIKDLEKFYNETYTSEKYKAYVSEEVKLRKLLEFKYEEICIRKLSENEREKCIEEDLKGLDIFDFFFEDRMHERPFASISGYNIGISFLNRNIVHLLNLLYNKGSIIVKQKLLNKFDYDDEIFENIEPGNYLVNDDEKNELNKTNVFNLISAYIIENEERQKNLRGLIFDYNKCIEIKKEIENEIKYEENDIDFL